MPNFDKKAKQIARLLREKGYEKKDAAKIGWASLTKKRGFHK